MGDSTAVGKEPCPDCGSRDNLVRYSDGHAYCFGMGCGRYEHATTSVPREGGRPVTDLIEGDYRAIEARGLTSETLAKFDYRRGTYQGQACHAATYRAKDGTPVAQKVRLPGKVFLWVGDPKRAGLFGQHLWRDGGRKLVITEGEIDALSMAQVQGLKWPVVSVANGAGGAAKSVAAQIDWVERFDEVVFMFDMDDPGRAAARECAELLTPGKARIAELPLKDANEMLVAGRTEEMLAAMWGAKVYRPDGIVAGAEAFDAIWDSLQGRPSIPYPWWDLNGKLHGMRRGEIVTFCAGTGVGKSTVCREIAYYLMKLGERVGYIALEESYARTAMGFLSIEMNRPLHLDHVGIDKAVLREAFDATLGHNRVFLYDHWGSIETEHLIRKIRQMVRGCGVEWVILDHISIVVSGIESQNERKDLDVAMTNLRKLSQELNIGIFLVSHLRRKDGNKGHEQGAEVSLSDLRGTQGIAQLSDAVVALERDQQAEEQANIARLRVLKNRFAGKNGLAGAVRYDEKTGRLEEAAPVEVTGGGQADF